MYIVRQFKEGVETKTTECRTEKEIKACLPGKLKKTVPDSIRYLNLMGNNRVNMGFIKTFDYKEKRDRRIDYTMELKGVFNGNME